MRATIDLTVICTIEDQFELLELARREVEAIKPREEWDQYYPTSPSDALRQIIRTSIAARLLPMESIRLHEIGQTLKDLDIPL